MKSINFATIGRTKQRVPGGWQAVFAEQIKAGRAAKKRAELEAEQWIAEVRARRAKQA